jgi:hypothetical protein
MSHILLTESRTGLSISSVDETEPLGVRFDDAAEAALAYRAHNLSGVVAQWGNGNTSWVVAGGVARRSQATHGQTFAGGAVTRQSAPKPVEMPRGGYEALSSAREHIDAGAERVMFTRHRGEVPGNVGVGIGVDDTDPRQGWTVYLAGGRLAPRV